MNKQFLSRDDVTFLKAVAIVLMVFHHFWAFPIWFAGKSDIHYWVINNWNVCESFGQFAKICVSIFAFITGYTMYYNLDKYKSIKYRFDKVKNLFINYWIIALLFLIVGFVLNELPPYRQILFNMFGLHLTMMDGKVCVSFAWYVFFYFIIMALAGLIIKIKKSKLWLFQIIFIFLVSGYLYNKNLDLLLRTGREIFIIINNCDLFFYIGVVLVGYIIAANQVFEKLETSLSTYNKYITNFIVTLVLVLIIIIRSKYGWYRGYFLETLMISVFIFSLIYITRKVNKKAKIFTLLSKHSMNIWFIHSMFFTGECRLQWIACLPKNALLIVIWTLCLCLILSVIFEKAKLFFIQKINFVQK